MSALLPRWLLIFVFYLVYSSLFCKMVDIFVIGSTTSLVFVANDLYFATCRSIAGSTSCCSATLSWVTNFVTLDEPITRIIFPMVCYAAMRTSMVRSSKARTITGMRSCSATLEMADGEASSSNPKLIASSAFWRHVFDYEFNDRCRHGKAVSKPITRTPRKTTLRAYSRSGCLESPIIYATTSRICRKRDLLSSYPPASTTAIRVRSTSTTMLLLVSSNLLHNALRSGLTECGGSVPLLLAM